MGSLLCYMLPSEQTKHFPDLFEILERDKQMLGISSIGVSITTLEEVFLRWVVQCYIRVNTVYFLTCEITLHCDHFQYVGVKEALV